MPIRPDLQQLEKCIDDVLRKNDFKPLKTLLQIDIYEDVKIKCSKQFLNKLDDLICRELTKKDAQTVSTVLVTIRRCSKNISILGQTGLLTMIKQGLVQKMVTWFEKSKEFILSQENSKEESVINMVEDLFDLLMVVHDTSDEGKKQVVESFIPRICALIIDSRVNICIQQETLKKMNAMLDKMPQDARKILFSQEMLILMRSLGERILDAGDYDFQVGIVEALCRMTTEKQRQELACHWFSMDFIAKAFKGIKDSEFETDCRIFLNLVNGILGDKRRVFTFPCIATFLDKYELKMPSDEKLEEFWIDFNLGSQTLSFYIAGDDDHQWEAVTVPEEKVQIYTIEVKDSKKLLTISLKNIVKIGKREGKQLLLYFDVSLEIISVTQKIFGANKYREFSRKQSISVAKTSVHIIFDEGGSQILVPESQNSSAEVLSSLKEKSDSLKGIAELPQHTKNINQGDRKNNQPEIITPSKRKMSEASMIVPGSDRYTVRSPILLINTSVARKKSKSPLPVMRSVENPGVSKTLKKKVDNAVSMKSRSSEGRKRGSRTDKHVKPAQIAEKRTKKETEFPNQNSRELHDTASDPQTVVKIGNTTAVDGTPVLTHARLSGVLNSCGNKMNSRCACWTPVTNINLCQKQISVSSGHNYNQEIVLSKELPKEKSSSSISNDNSEETGRTPEKKEIMKRSKRDTAEVWKRNCQQGINHSKHLEHKKFENTNQSDWHIESETTFKSVHLNKTVEESLIYRKKYIVSKDKEESKEKGYTDAAESLINQINKRYKPKEDMNSTRKLKDSLVNGDFPNKLDLQFSKEKVQKRGYRQLKTTLVNVTSECPLNDVYNFNLNGANEPVIKLGTKHHKNKNLFSDTDTEYRCDDSRTDVSWIKETRSKPQLVDYSRHKKGKPRKMGKASEQSRQRGSSPEREQPRSKMTAKKNIAKQVDETVSDWRTRLRRRATKTKKNYKDLSNSESESEEFSPSLKEKLLVKEDNLHSRSNATKLPKKQQNAFTVEIQERSKEWEDQAVVKDLPADGGLGGSPPTGSSSSIEVMRCREEITEGVLTRGYDHITGPLPPDPKRPSPASLNRKYGAGSSRQSPRNCEKNLLHTRESCSPIPRSLSFGSRSPSLLSLSSEEREKTGQNVPPDTVQVPDPMPLNRKRMYIEDNLSNLKEIEEQEEGRGRMLPRKMSKAEDPELHSEPGDNVSIPEEHSETENSNVEMIYEKANTEIQKKVKVNEKLMKYFTKESWKTAQQHVKTVKHHIQEYRIKKLDTFQFIIIEELEKFERDSQTLKDLEKEFADFWEKIYQKFAGYQKCEQQRLHLLKAALEKYVFYNTDYEETVFTTEMSSMKEDMKMLQERLLKEMQQEDLLNVRKGLVSLFMAYE
ncbi:synaptonemal complex protein 2 [Sorex araneus]|uniref:synaptonemal complex protein 2 n=1 Tax=Sorex araneus TaxID=42254 RepID=UPI00243388A7|nr:synaptonemal complex protein 2 [Sorex araneus]